MKRDDRYDKPSDKKVDTVRETPLTYDDYANLPDDGIRYELVDGRLEAMTPAPLLDHQIFLGNLFSAVNATCENDYFVVFSPVDVILSLTEVRQPDLVMVHRSRMSIITIRGVEGPPDLVAEILSPYSVKRDRRDKLKIYAQYGIPEYWIIDMKNGHLEQYILHDNEYELDEIYLEDTPVRSERNPCISFNMRDVLKNVPELLN